MSEQKVLLEVDVPENFNPLYTTVTHAVRGFESELDFRIVQPALAQGDGVPSNCRQRLAAEGKAYPRSSCAVCGAFSPKWKECDAALSAQREQPQGVVVPIMAEVERILSGIDREDDTDGGWWETSTGAEFGREKLQELRALLGQREG